METIVLSESGIVAAAARAAEVVSHGGVVLFPTDTLYGLGVDAFSDDALAKVYAIKGRDEGKPIHAIVSSVDMASRFGTIDANAAIAAAKLPKGAVTLIVPKNEECETGICRAIASFGFRIPDNDFCKAFSEAFGGPITATSANKSGEAPLFSVPHILAQLGGNASQIDLVIDGGELPPRAPSTVIDFTGGGPVILREGAVPAADVWDVLRIQED